MPKRLILSLVLAASLLAGADIAGADGPGAAGEENSACRGHGDRL